MTLYTTDIGVFRYIEFHAFSSLIPNTILHFNIIIPIVSHENPFLGNALAELYQSFFNLRKKRQNVRRENNLKGFHNEDVFCMRQKHICTSEALIVSCLFLPPNKPFNPHLESENTSSLPHPLVCIRGGGVKNTHCCSQRVFYYRTNLHKIHQKVSYNRPSVILLY